MAELLVRATDQPLSGDPYVDCHRSPRGAVIVICPDGWPWTATELKNPDWRILKFPGLKDSDLAGYVAHEPGYDGSSKTARRWAFKLDLDNPLLPLARTLSDTIALKVALPKIADPRVIGLPPKVIG